MRIAWTSTNIQRISFRDAQSLMLTESSLVRDCYNLSSIDKDLLTEKDVLLF